jgi:hypothetical protein
MFDWLSAIGGAIAGFGGGFTLKSVITIRRSTDIASTATNDSMRNVTQRDNQAGGSIAGRDIKTK